MNWDRIEGNWKQMKGALKEKWGKLTDDEFAGSREFAQLYGAVDNARFLDLIAQNVDSGIDPDQRAQWLAQLDSGALTRGQVMLALSESDDFRELAHGHVLVAIEGLRRTRNPH